MRTIYEPLPPAEGPEDVALGWLKIQFEIHVWFRRRCYVFGGGGDTLIKM